MDVAEEGEAERAIRELRQRITDGTLRPGARLSEPAIAAQLGVSRNTLREAFRVLTHAGLLVARRHKGVAVTTVDHGSVAELYQIRRMVEVAAIAQSRADHPAVDEMRRAVRTARVARQESAWRRVATENMAFHAAVVQFADSPRIAAWMEDIVATLRLVFEAISDPRAIHEPFVEQNGVLLDRVENEDSRGAAELLAVYLDQSERAVLERMPSITTSGH